MRELFKPGRKKYLIAYDLKSFHPVDMSALQVTTTGLSNLESFNTEVERDLRFKTLTGRTKVESIRE